MRAAFHLLYRELLVSGARKGRLERNASLHVTSVMGNHFVVILSVLRSYCTCCNRPAIDDDETNKRKKKKRSRGGNLYNIQLLDSYFLDKPDSSDETRIGHPIEQTSEVPSGKLFNERWQRY